MCAGALSVLNVLQGPKIAKALSKMVITSLTASSDRGTEKCAMNKCPQ